ncbi:transposase IS605 OrfB family [Geobacillus stearothermophilus]|nr:transposase IS605 OrfB family [Geobacillus stearothermophilus]
MFIHQLQYKAEEQGVRVIVTEESYTSKCSFLDMEEIKKQKQYKGKRIKRGLFQSEKGILINADVNGAYNIIRKVFPKAFADGIEGVGLHPVKLNVA